jgi:hypothetical protein
MCQPGPLQKGARQGMREACYMICTLRIGGFVKSLEALTWHMQSIAPKPLLLCIY